jgi:hypothetical protein
MAVLKIPINSDEISYYRQAITIMRFIPPFSSLRVQEIFILGWLMYFYNKISKEIKEEREINTLLFSSYRSELIDKLIVNDDDGKAYEKAYSKLNNILVSLRKKGFILNKKNRDYLNPKFIFNPNKINEIKFIFKF